MVTGQLVFALTKIGAASEKNTFRPIMSVPFSRVLKLLFVYQKRPTDGATVHALKSASEKVRTKKCVRKSTRRTKKCVRPKKSYFLSAWEYVKLPFSLRVLKK
jgi:hypothetical protein